MSRKTVNKLVYHYDDILGDIESAVDIIMNPVAQTMSPKGGNVIYEDHNGHQHVTNDGFTIVKNLFLKDPVKNAIIEIIKSASIQTNLAAGDGTSSTVLQSGILIKEGLRLVKNGKNQIDVKNTFEKFGNELIDILSKETKQIKNDKELEFISLVSSSNDKEISDTVVKVIKFVGKDGQVMIEPSYSDKTEIVEDNGYVTSSGVFAQELLQENGHVKYDDIPVLVTDKRLYYKAEAESILKTVKDSGYNSLVIIASDFLNEAINFFIANHNAGKINLVLIKETDTKIITDIATYIGVDVISEKTGNVVDDITIEQFGLAKSIFGGVDKVIISRFPEKNKKLDTRIKTLREELKEIGDKESLKYKDVERRIASLTRGMATIKVGGRTPLEVNEKIHRYEDAINAARVAMQEGYLVGGGISMYHAFRKLSDYGEFNEVFRKVCSANLEQICKNCGTLPSFVYDGIEKSKSKTVGYNALTGELSDMLKDGVIEPFLVTKNVINNAISIANVIISSRYLMLNDIEEEK